MLKSIILIGWFFIIQSQLPDYPGALAITRDGPFKTETDCKAYRQSMIDIFEGFGVVAKFGPCYDQKEV